MGVPTAVMPRVRVRVRLGVGLGLGLTGACVQLSESFDDAFGGGDMPEDLVHHKLPN